MTVPHGTGLVFTTFQHLPVPADVGPSSVNPESAAPLEAETARQR